MIRARDIRTGDTVLPPSASQESVVQHVRTYRETMRVDYTHRATAELSPRTLVRVYRKSRSVKKDAPEVVFTSEGVS